MFFGLCVCEASVQQILTFEKYNAFLMVTLEFSKVGVELNVKTKNCISLEN